MIYQIADILIMWTLDISLNLYQMLQSNVSPVQCCLSSVITSGRLGTVSLCHGCPSLMSCGCASCHWYGTATWSALRWPVIDFATWPTRRSCVRLSGLMATHLQQIDVKTGTCIAEKMNVFPVSWLWMTRQQ